MHDDRGLEDVWETYVRSWNATTPEERRVLFENSLDPGCVYRDPLIRAEGWDALIAYILDFQRQVAGGRFVTRYFMDYGDQSIARWDMQGADGSVLGDGISYGEYGPDRKLVRMTGFFETPR